MYSFVIFVYLLAVKIAALFNHKARLMVKGHSEVFGILRERIDRNEKYLWFHAASLGEFEQGRPLMEHIKKEYPQYKILLTFFSPSGYEVQKNYKGADVICYLPFDTPFNARRFVKLAHPYMAFFIKYEFWQNYLKGLQKLNVPTYSISSIFRKNQVFFRWYGGTYYKVLTRFTYLFVQNESSKELLSKLRIQNVSIIGDTRFDRVLTICHQAADLPLIESFVTAQSENSSERKILVAGSSWAPDEDIFIRYFNEHPEIKLVMAPHVIDENHLTEICTKLKRPFLKYSEATLENVRTIDCLIIDCFGLLSSIYRYGQVAYIGGGFGVSIHNVPEAAVYGMPVIFGPNNKKFREAQDLKNLGCGFEIQSFEDCQSLLNKFFSDKDYLEEIGKKAGDYIKVNSGAVEKILRQISL